MLISLGISLALALVGPSTVDAHSMQLQPISRGDPRLHGYPVNYDLTSPLYDPYFGHGVYPCHNPRAGPISQTVAAGSTITVTIGGPDQHRGGHCQWAISYDNGETFIVLETILVKCLRDHRRSFPVHFPPETPASPRVVFAWAWINAEGDRQYYMNCADIAITSNTNRTDPLKAPELLIGNLNKNPASPLYGPYFDEWLYYGNDGSYYFKQRDEIQIDHRLVPSLVRRNGPWGRVIKKHPIPVRPTDPHGMAMSIINRAKASVQRVMNTAHSIIHRATPGVALAPGLMCLVGTLRCHGKMIQRCGHSHHWMHVSACEHGCVMGKLAPACLANSAPTLPQAPRAPAPSMVMSMRMAAPAATPVAVHVAHPAPSPTPTVSMKMSTPLATPVARAPTPAAPVMAMAMRSAVPVKSMVKVKSKVKERHGKKKSKVVIKTTHTRG